VGLRRRGWGIGWVIGNTNAERRHFAGRINTLSNEGMHNRIEEVLEELERKELEVRRSIIRYLN
jgi:ABC-type Na+ transport system ATPase subunit NatA